MRRRRYVPARQKTPARRMIALSYHISAGFSRGFEFFPSRAPDFSRVTTFTRPDFSRAPIFHAPRFFARLTFPHSDFSYDGFYRAPRPVQKAPSARKGLFHIPNNCIAPSTAYPTATLITYKIPSSARLRFHDFMFLNRMTNPSPALAHSPAAMPPKESAPST